MCCQGQTKVIKPGSVQDSNGLTYTDYLVRGYSSACYMTLDITQHRGTQPSKWLMCDLSLSLAVYNCHSSKMVLWLISESCILDCCYRRGYWLFQCTIWVQWPHQQTPHAWHVISCRQIMMRCSRVINNRAKTCEEYKSMLTKLPWTQRHTLYTEICSISCIMLAAWAYIWLMLFYFYSCLGQCDGKEILPRCAHLHPSRKPFS